ncbi:MAG: DegV family protein [Atopobiaceae bacterium]
MGIRVVCDSSCNVYALDGVDFRSVPLTVTLDGTDYVDTEGLDLTEFCDHMSLNQGPSSTSCPSPDAWLSAFQGADEIVAIAISGKLSGSCNSARLAAAQYQEDHPEAKIAVIDSRAAGEYLALLAERANELGREPIPFEELTRMLLAYQHHVHVLFDIADLSNLAKAGRVNPAVARFANALDVHVIGTGTLEGEIEVLRKVRGAKKAARAMIHEMEMHRYSGGPCYISHVENVGGAEFFRDELRKVWPDADIRLERCHALCSYYAARGGLIVSYADSRKVNPERDLPQQGTAPIIL